MTFKKVTHVIFDMDGLLLNTEILYEKIIIKMLKKFGHVYSLELQMKLRGTSDKQTIATMIKELGLNIGVDELLKIYKEEQKEGLKNPELLPGAERLVRHLAKHNIPIALATSSFREFYEMKTENYKDLFSLFHHLVSASDSEVKCGKPAPDIFLICAEKFPNHPDPKECLVFEDAPNGVKGALAAGMQVVLVPSKGVPRELRTATLVLDSLEEFKPELFGLPAF